MAPHAQFDPTRIDRSVEDRVVVIGAGIGGLSAAMLLAHQGLHVTVLEAADEVGGKMRRVPLQGGTTATDASIFVDAGPTVVTMAPTLREVFAGAGEDLDAHVTLHPLEVLARHAWTDGCRLDLFTDIERSAAEIESVFGPKHADGYCRFVRYAEQIHDEVRGPFMESARPDLTRTALTLASRGLGAVRRIDWARTMWRSLGDFFPEPRLRQLFARYATYYGSSPFRAPATLNLIADVERRGVWTIQGGMHQLAAAMQRVCLRKGVEFRLGEGAAEIEVANGRVGAVMSTQGVRYPAHAIVANVDPNALYEGRLGKAAQVAGRRVRPRDRSLSAVTWCALASAENFELEHHNVFFSSDYADEFARLSDARQMPHEPTVYLCAQDRTPDRVGTVTFGRASEHTDTERMLILINAPAFGDERRLTPPEQQGLQEATRRMMEQCGLRLTMHEQQISTPHHFEEMFPTTGGALYGPACHSSMAPFTRPSARTKLPGLYLCGGGTHPGSGVPMVALSGKIAAQEIGADRALTSRSRGTATRGGTSTRSPTMAGTP